MPCDDGAEMLNWLLGFSYLNTKVQARQILWKLYRQHASLKLFSYLIFILIENSAIILLSIGSFHYPFCKWCPIYVNCQYALDEHGGYMSIPISRFEPGWYYCLEKIIIPDHYRLFRMPHIKIKCTPIPQSVKAVKKKKW